MKQAIKTGFGLMLVIGLAMGAGCGESESSQSTDRTKAYNFSLKGLDGKMYQLEDFEGKVVIVDIWDTWCPPCKAEIPHFIDLYNKYKKDGFVMIGIAGGRYGEDAVRQFVQDRDIPYPNLMATMEAIRGFGNITGIPTTFVIDKKGYVYKKYVGLTSKAIFEQDIKTLLQS